MRLKRLLRSPRIAVRLLLFVSGYSFVATLVPQGSTRSASVVGWALAHPGAESVVRLLGLHSAFSSPLFTTVMVWLAFSTAVCAWERTSSARMWMGRRGTVDEVSLERLRNRPDERLHLDAERPLEVAEAALSKLGFKTTRGPRLIEARAGEAGLLGSPVFHWALVALFVFVILGQATRSEGRLGVALGDQAANQASEYRSLTRGPLYFDGFRDLKFEVRRFRTSYRSGGVDYGVTPEVVVWRGDAVLTKGWLRPNHPLRVESMVIHDGGFGVAARFRLLDETGKTVSQLPVLADFEGATPQGTAPQSVGLTIDGQDAGVLSVSVPVDHTATEMFRRPPSDVRAFVSLDGSATSTVRPGAPLSVGRGYKLALDDIVFYERLSVVDDWSVYAIYVAFLLGGIGLTLSLFWAPRSVYVLLVEGEEPVLHVVAKHRRREPGFSARVVQAIASENDAVKG